MQKKDVAREGRCIDCNERIAVYTDVSRDKCWCDRHGMTPKEYAYRVERYCGYCKCTPCICDGHGNYLENRIEKKG
jgi:hypothetical protein